MANKFYFSSVQPPVYSGSLFIHKCIHHDLNNILFVVFLLYNFRSSFKVLETLQKIIFRILLSIHRISTCLANQIIYEELNDSVFQYASI